MIKTALFAAAATLATLATAAPVLAKDVLVHYGDLDLASAEGQRTFARRIDRAAKAACDYELDGRIKHPKVVTCYKQARAKARTEMATVLDDVRLGG